MLCSEIMEDKVKSVDQNDDVGKAAKMMRDSEIGFVPVCDPESSKLVGTLTDRDITIRLVAENKPPKTKVAEIMSRAPMFCHCNDDVEEARELMEANQISRMIVLDENERLAGVISLFDIAGIESTDRTGETLSEIKQP